MGEVSEMMLNGTLCVECGAYIEEGEPDGVPRSCRDCKKQKRQGKKGGAT